MPGHLFHIAWWNQLNPMMTGSFFLNIGGGVMWDPPSRSFAAVEMHQSNESKTYDSIFCHGFEAKEGEAPAEQLDINSQHQQGWVLIGTAFLKLKTSKKRLFGDAGTCLLCWILVSLFVGL